MWDKICPKEKRDCPFEEAARFRTLMIMMMVLHIIFSVADVFAYGQFFSIFWEFGLCYLAYYCYMRLSPTAIYMYIALLGICAVVGVIGIIGIFSKSVWAILIYPIHIGIYGFAAYFIFKKLRLLTAAEEEYKNQDPDIKEELGQEHRGSNKGGLGGMKEDFQG